MTDENVPRMTRVFVIGTRAVMVTPALTYVVVCATCDAEKARYRHLGMATQRAIDDSARTCSCGAHE